MRGKVGWGVALACAAWGAAAWGREAEPEKFWREAKSPRRKHPSQLARAAARALPAVVAITTHTSAQSSQDSAGLGAGFIVTPDGYILTSEHVVDGATDVRVQLWNAGEPSEEVPARVVGVDKATDTALLKVDVRRRLPSLRLASVADVQLADWVVVIGNPFGLSQSVTVGVVSYQGRTDINPTGAPGYLDYLQTDAPINPGSSGGPILDLAGDVVAIANAVNVSGQGIGFGIPIDIAKAVLPQLKASGSVRRGWLGVSVEDLTPELTEVFHARPPGVLVSNVVRGGPGWKCGLQTGDVITSVGDAKVLHAQALRWQVTTRGIGRSVRVAGVRAGKPFVTTVTLGEMPPGQLLAAERKFSPSSVPEGAIVDEVDEVVSAKAGLAEPFGALVRVVRPGSALAHAGISAGDIVLKVNHSEVGSKEDLVRSLEEVPGGGWVRMFVRRGPKTLLFELRRP